jgi:hypothetical protein
MTLSEIETILEELAVRHHNLNTELLTTLLTASGWEEKNVKEALTLFKQRESAKQATAQTSVLPVVIQASAVVPVVENKDEITFYQPDGSEEKELVGFVDIPSVKRKETTYIPKEVAEEVPPAPIVSKIPEPVVAPFPKEPELKKEAILQEIPLQKIREVESLVGERKEDSVVNERSKDERVIVPPQATIFKEPEPQSLVVSPSPLKERSKTKESEIPADLPLLPFESSPHVWSFSRYKNVFHGDDSTTLMKVEPVRKEIPFYVEPQKPLVIVNKKVDDEEISVEKIPLTRGDESLVFLAGVMLLVIMLILGYMYGNGRL